MHTSVVSLKNPKNPSLQDSISNSKEFWSSVCLMLIIFLFLKKAKKLENIFILDYPSLFDELDSSVFWFS